MSELPPAPSVRIIRREDAAAWQDGYAFLDAARRQGEAILSQARTALERAENDARLAASAALDRETDEMRRQAMGKIEASLAGMEAEIVGLVMTITQQVIGTMPDHVVAEAITRKAIAEFRHEKLKAVRVPAGAVAVTQDVLAGMPEGQGVKVEGDRSLIVGACVLNGERTVVDAGLHSQLDTVRLSMNMPRRTR